MVLVAVGERQPDCRHINSRAVGTLKQGCFKALDRVMLCRIVSGRGSKNFELLTPLRQLPAKPQFWLPPVITFEEPWTTTQLEWATDLP
ncbi:uncharacterized protein PgNI_04103 [Pyricularia grisea]|uniref:Uncharacterized protein n=1 Tax=Pyricularia grisea TaxID=148305 RepID=A0A6P8BA33_PYRGI|nr:uncharacterized protein PgNI_04103 [Pyricularia grisea]TLD12669.1 hypothetical protein PgNI_04103 [Pyricularia grisea]